MDPKIVVAHHDLPQNRDGPPRFRVSHTEAIWVDSGIKNGSKLCWATTINHRYGNKFYLTITEVSRRPCMWKRPKIIKFHFRENHYFRWVFLLLSF